MSEDGDTVVVKGGRTPQVLARNDVGERMVASPAISDGRLFLRTDEHLIAIGGAICQIALSVRRSTLRRGKYHGKRQG